MAICLIILLHSKCYSYSAINLCQYRHYSWVNIIRFSGGSRICEKGGPEIQLPENIPEKTPENKKTAKKNKNRGGGGAADSAPPGSAIAFTLLDGAAKIMAHIKTTNSLTTGVQDPGSFGI